MTLTQQFIVVTALPASFAVLFLITLRTRSLRRQLLLRWWLVLLTAGIWASSALSYYGGTTLPVDVSYSWRIVGNYALSLLAIWLLLTTIEFLGADSYRGRLSFWLSVVLWLVALGLDPNWPYDLPTLLIADQSVRHFDLWGAVWLTSWLMPAVLAWLLSQWATKKLGYSSSRNRARYWFLTTSLFIIGMVPGLFRQLVWQQVGLIITVPAATVGTISLSFRQLPELHRATRRVAGRLLGGLIVLGLSWLAFWYIAQTGLDAPADLGVTFPAAVFAALLVALYYFVSWLTDRLVLPQAGGRATMLVQKTLFSGRWLEPEGLGKLAIQFTSTYLGAEDAWLMLLEEGPAGHILLRPLCSSLDDELDPASFSAESPFLVSIWQDRTPFLQDDIEHLGLTETMDGDELRILEGWQRAVYVPLVAAEQPLALLGLGPKRGGDPYDAQDLALLQELTTHLGPLLQQALHAEGLRRAQNFAFQQNERLGREIRYLKELTNLQGKFLKLVSRELRRSGTIVQPEPSPLQPGLSADAPETGERGRQTLGLSPEIRHRLRKIAARLENLEQLQWQVVSMEVTVRGAMANLSTMAEARQINVEFALIGTPPPVYGDKQRLTDAVQQVLHNAIKFSRIGGQVRVQCRLEAGRIVVEVADDGVGIAAERLPHLWDGFDEHAGGAGQALGLGLPLTRFVVRAHGGQIAIDSMHGVGTTCTLSFPAFLEEEV